MYYLAIAAANKHVAEYGPSKGKEVANDAYRQVQGQPKTMQQAYQRLLELVGTAKPGTKVKLVVTVPHPIQSSADELAELRAKVAALEQQQKQA